MNPADRTARKWPWRSRLRRTGCWAQSLAVALVFAGCSSPKQITQAHGGLRLSAADAPLGLSRVQPVQEFAVYLPASRGEAARAFARDGAAELAPEAAIVFPITALLGGVIGASLGLDAEVRARAASVILETAGGAAVEDRLARRLRDHLRRGGDLRELPPNIPVDPPEAPGHLMRDESGRMVWAKAPPPAHPAAGGDVQTIIHLRLGRQGLDAFVDPHVSYSGDAENPNPALALVLTAEVIAIRVRDWSSPGGVTVIYRSLPHRFTEWADDGGARLRRELDAGLDYLGGQLAQQIILGDAPAPDARMPQRDAQAPAPSEETATRPPRIPPAGGTGP